MEKWNSDENQGSFVLKNRKKVLIVELFRKGLTLVLIDYIMTVVSI